MNNTLHQILAQPFTWGAGLGLVFAAIIFYRYLQLGSEMKRYKRHLSDKLEIEAESIKRMRQEQESLRKENENLRVKVAALNEMPDRKVLRDIEVFARAEKRMLVSVPGFAPAWENAKSSALEELGEEESGRSIPKRVFAKLFAPTRKEDSEKALPDMQSSS